MSIARAIAILGAGAAGYSSGEERARQAARQQEDDAFRREQRDRTRTQWQRDDAEFKQTEADKQAERAAMAPTTMTLELTPEQQGPQGFQAGGKTYGDPSTAKAAADAYNAPQAGIRRAAAAVQNPLRAAELTGKASGLEANDLQLQRAREDDAARKFDRQLVGSVQKGGWDGLAKFMSESGADGAGGGMKFAVKKDGGNVTLYRVGPDGTALDAGQTFPDTEESKAKVSFLLAQGTSPALKLEHFRNEARDKVAREDKEAYNKRADEAEKRRGIHEDRMYAATVARGTGLGGATRRADHFDEKEWDAVRKVDPALVSFEDPASGKLAESSDLRTIYISELNRNRSTGSMSPNEAMEASRTVIGALREKASAMADAAKKADPKSTMTEAQAVRQIMKQYQQALKAPADAPPGAAPGGPPGAAPAAVQRPGTSAPPIVGMQAAARPEPGMPGNPTGDSVLNRVVAESSQGAQQRAAVLQPQLDALAQAKARMVAVARSGDGQAIALHAANIAQARKALEAAAKNALGSDAAAFLSTVQ